MNTETSEPIDFAMFDAPPARPVSVPFGVGGSELALAMLTFGLVDATTAPRWMRERCETAKRHACPRWVATKVGLAKKSQDETMRRGERREPEILSAWISRLERDEWQHECEREIDPESVMWSGALPREFPPFKDRHSPIVAKPDGWARTWDGKLVLLSIKAARYGFAKPAWWNGIDEAPWYYAAQLHGEMAVVRAKSSILIVGGGWNRDEDDPRSDGPLLAFHVPRSDADCDRVRDVARRAWDELIVPKVFPRT